MIQDARLALETSAFLYGNKQLIKMCTREELITHTMLKKETFWMRERLQLEGLPLWVCVGLVLLLKIKL